MFMFPFLRNNKGVDLAASSFSEILAYWWNFQFVHSDERTECPGTHVNKHSLTKPGSSSNCWQLHTNWVAVAFPLSSYNADYLYERHIGPVPIALGCASPSMTNPSMNIIIFAIPNHSRLSVVSTKYIFTKQIWKSYICIFAGLRWSSGGFLQVDDLALTILTTILTMLNQSRRGFMPAVSWWCDSLNESLAFRVHYLGKSRFADRMLNC